MPLFLQDLILLEGNNLIVSKESILNYVNLGDVGLSYTIVR